MDSAAHEYTGITNVRLLDPVTEKVSGPSTIRFRGDRVDAVTEGVESDEYMLDAGGKIAIPGLVDCHVHITADSANLGDLGGSSPSYIAASAIHTMQKSLMRGFTTLRDCGGADYGFANALEQRLVFGPHLFFAGKSLSQTGGHADMRGPGTNVFDSHPCCPHMGTICDGVSEVRKAARSQIRTGVNHIKLMLSGGVASPTDRVDSTQFSDEEIVAAVEEATAANIYAAGHAYTARAINRGLRLGVRSIEHGNLLDDESVSLFLEHDAFLVPTLVTYERQKAEGVEAGFPAASLAKTETVRVAGLDALKKASRGGVKIAFGTDLLGNMRNWQSHEFEIRSQVQSPGDILRSATVVAAELLDAVGEIGVISPGSFADVVILNGNPLDNVSVLSDPETGVSDVFSQGRLAEF